MSDRGGEDELDVRSFEVSFEQLQDLVRRLEGGTLTLDDSLAHYELGVKALRRCYRILDLAEKRLELLVRESDGSLGTSPCDLEQIRGEARGGARLPAAAAAAPAVSRAAEAPPPPRHPAAAEARASDPRAIIPAGAAPAPDAGPTPSVPHAAIPDATLTAQAPPAPKSPKPSPGSGGGGSLFDGR